MPQKMQTRVLKSDDGEGIEVHVTDEHVTMDRNGGHLTQMGGFGDGNPIMQISVSCVDQLMIELFCPGGWTIMLQPSSGDIYQLLVFRSKGDAHVDKQYLTRHGEWKEVPTEGLAGDAMIIPLPTREGVHA